MLALLLAALLALTQADPMAPLVAQARTLVDQVMASDTAPFVALFNDKMKAAVTEAQFRDVLSSVVVQAGAYTRQVSTRTQTQNGMRAVMVTCEFERSHVDLSLVFDESGKIAGFFMRPAAAAAPASYFLDLRGYNPPEAARSLKQGLLVLQGERDYQVTMDDFAAWLRALAGRPDVTLRSYPGLNHLFMAGDGPPNPGEYSKPGHVAEAVITDIAAWVRR